ncbi:hypothetical protein [Rathayibacter soli]|uniref:hypothetical protein n=1 Tax=Rathayibacter soli TaxID=3144168 RepID=UPI0027E50AEA|nr:hypothetical protein [Glaciibacter superstes]
MNLIPAASELDPCKAFTFCNGHRPTESGVDLRSHVGPFITVRSGESLIEFDIAHNEDTGETAFEFDIDIWTIDPSELDTELADIRAIFDQFEAAARAFDLEQYRRHPEVSS